MMLAKGKRDGERKNTRTHIRREREYVCKKRVLHVLDGAKYEIKRVTCVTDASN